MNSIAEYVKRLPVIGLALSGLLIAGVASAEYGTSEPGPSAATDVSMKVTTTVPDTTTVTESVTTIKGTAPILEPAAETRASANLDVPFISQNAEGYPTGCELVSTSMLLKFHGYDISAGDLVKLGYIGTSIVTMDGFDDGELHGNDPNDFFIGDPLDEGGFGCYSGAITKCLDKYLMDSDLAPSRLDGMSMEDLCRRYIDNGYPVLIWASMYMEPTRESQFTWVLEKEQVTKPPETTTTVTTVTTTTMTTTTEPATEPPAPTEAPPAPEPQQPEPVAPEPVAPEPQQPAPDPPAPAPVETEAPPPPPPETDAPPVPQETPTPEPQPEESASIGLTASAADKQFFTWRFNEHCLVLVGYNEKYYIFNDPLREKNTYYDKEVVEKRFEEMGKMAVAIVPLNP